MKDYYIKTKDLSVGYQGKVLIRDINLDIEKGEIVTLIGPNGAGKSTILKSITRQLKLIGGEVYLDSDEIRKLSYKSMARKVAVMLTERMKPELMTCHDVVATGRYPYTGRLGVLSREDENKVDEALMAVHAQELGIRNFLEISDGQRQRILLARAICQEPQVIVLDEPTAFLDIRHKLELLYLLKNMVREKKVAVLMSLHELDLAQKISDHIICVKGDNSIGRFGTPEEIFSGDYIKELGKTLNPDVYEQKGEDIWVAKSATVAPTACLNGPCIVDEEAEIRHCAFVRGSAIIGKGAVVGNSTELKNVILSNKVQVPHYNYVGDSILGYKAHMGAGSITSNVKSDKTLVVVKSAEENIETGLKKFGAMLGDCVEVGCRQYRPVIHE